MGGSEKKVNRNTYNISSIKRVSGGFTFESCKTTAKKCIKKCAASGKLFICRQVDLFLLFFTVLGWGFDCLCWPWGRAFDWSCSPRRGDIWILSFLRPTWRYLTADSDERNWDQTYVSPLPRFTHAPYGLKRSGSHGGQWEQAKAEWISLFCLQISFVLACFWSIEPLKILWYQSKRK